MDHVVEDDTTPDRMTRAPAAADTPGGGRRRSGETSDPDARDAHVEKVRAMVGARIRELRTRQDMGLRQLAAASGVTAGFLSQIESSAVMPSISTLVKICAALHVAVGEVFDAPGPRAHLVRRSERSVYAYPDSGIRDEVLTADPTHRLEVVHSYFEPSGSTGGQPYAHGSQVEAAIVLKGRLVVRLGDDEFRLRAGDTLTFPGATPHEVRNPYSRPAEVIWVYTPATY